MIGFLCISILTMYIRELRIENTPLEPDQVEITNKGPIVAAIDPLTYRSTANSVVEKFDERHAIIISGPITNETAEKFEAALTDETETVIIASPGGDLIPAIKISRLVFIHQLATLVPQRGMCYSACTMIFQAGFHRLAYADSMFMYHSAKEVNEKTGESRPDQSATAFYWSYLLLFNINDQLLYQLKDMNTDYYIKAPNAVKYNVVQEIIPVDTPNQKVYVD